MSVEQLVEAIISAQGEEVDLACKRLLDSFRNDSCDAIVILAPKLLANIAHRALGPPGDPSHDIGEIPIRLWECLKIVGCIKDIALDFPSLCETHFAVLYGETLPALAKRDAPEHDAAWGLLICSMLTLWSPQLGTHHVNFEKAFSVIVSFVAKENQSIKYAATTILEVLASSAPSLAEKWVQKMIDSLKTGFLVSVPVLSALYTAQPSAQLFEKHNQWLLQLFESDKSLQPHIATLFHNMAKKNPAILEGSIQRMWYGLSQASTVVEIELAFSNMARNNPVLFLGRLDDIIKVPTKHPHSKQSTIHLLAATGSYSHQAAELCSVEILKLMDINGNDTKSQVVGLEQLIWLDGQKEGVLTRHALLIQALVMSENADVREIAYRACSRVAGGALSVLRVPQTQIASDDTRHAIFGTFVVKEYKPWKDYYEVQRNVRETTTMPLVMMAMRFDGTLGFFGGFCEEGDTLLHTLDRELREELNYSEGVAGFQHIASHQLVSKKIRSHFFAKIITEAEFKNIETAFSRAPHFGSEIVGIMRVPLLIMSSGRGLEAFFRHNFESGALHELVALLRQWNLVGDVELTECLVGAGIHLS